MTAHIELGLFAENEAYVRWLTVLVHFLWQATLICLAVAVARTLMRNCRAASRYLVSVSGLIALPLGAVATWCLANPASVPLSQPTAPQQRSTRHLSATFDPAIRTSQPEPEVESRQSSSLPRGSHRPQAVASIRDSDESVTTAPHRDTSVQEPSDAQLAMAVTFAHLFGVGIFLTRFVLAVCGCRRHRRFSQRVTDREMLTRIADSARAVGLRNVPRVAYSARMRTPTVIGIVRPIVLLPITMATGLDAEQFSAVLRHEFAHIRRYDLTLNAIQRLIESVFFFHPAVWLVSRQVSHEREACCDDIVLETGVSRWTYADALIRMAESQASVTRPSSAAVAASGSGFRQFELRVQRLVDGTPLRASHPTTRGTILLATTVLAVIATPLWIQAWAMGQADDASRDQSATSGAEKTRPTADATPELPFGRPSDGLRLRIRSVSSETDAEAPQRGAPMTQYSRAENLTLAAELENVSEAPVTVVGVRAGNRIHRGGGRLHTAFFAPHLFDLLITDAKGQPIARPERRFEESIHVISGASTHKLAPGERLSILLKPADFLSPMDYRLNAGRYRLRVRYRGPSPKSQQQLKEFDPKNPHTAVWNGQVISNEVAVSIANSPRVGSPQPLQFGPVKDGLQAAIQLHVGTTIDDDPTKLPGVPIRTPIRIVFHVRNVSDDVISFASETARQGDSVRVTDADGNVVPVRSTFFTGEPIDVRWTLKPGETAELPVLTPSLSSITKPGKYRVRFTIRFDSRQQRDAEGNVVFPRPGDWQSQLRTGTIDLYLREAQRKDREDSTFSARVSFESESGDAVTEGVFSIRRRDAGLSTRDRTIDAEVVRIEESTNAPVTLTVRAPGFEEASFHDIRFSKDRPTRLQLKPALRSRFRLTSAVDGAAVSGARIRFFNRTGAKASVGPYPTDGIDGPVWARSQSDGHVELDVLQRQNPHVPELGDSVYFFYVEPNSAELAPCFVGPIKAGQDLGEVVVGPILEVSGEVRGTPKQLKQFAAEWDQPYQFRTGNPEAAGTYAVSRDLRTRRVGDKLVFHLTGLRPGKLRFVANFEPRPHIVSHTYSRRDPGDSDTVVELDLTKSLNGVVLQAKEEPNAEERKAVVNAPLECRFYDGVTGKLLEDRQLTFHIRIKRPNDDGTEVIVHDVFWGPNVGNRVTVQLPETVMSDPDRDQLVLDWGVRHPRYRNRAGRATILEFLTDDEIRRTLQRLKLVPRPETIVAKLDERVKFRADDEVLYGVLTRIEEEFGVPVTLSLRDIHAKQVSAHTRVSVPTGNVRVRDAIALTLEDAGLNVDFSDEGAYVPAKRWAALRIRYSIPEADDEARVVVRHKGEGEFGAESLGLSKWTPIAQGDSYRLDELPAGLFTVARLKTVPITARESRGFYLDRREMTLNAGDARRVAFVRDEGASVALQVTGKFDRHERTVVVIGSPKALDHNELGNANITLFDAQRCDAQGRVTTERLATGEYAAFAIRYGARRGNGREPMRQPTHVGRTTFRVTEHDSVGVVKIPLKRVASPDAKL